MKYIIITKNAKIVVNEAEKDKFVSNLERSQSPLLPIKGQLVDRFGIEIYDFEFFLKQENDKLKFKNLRRCRECAEIINRADPCSCKDKPALRENNIFKLDQTKKPILLTQ